MRAHRAVPKYTWAGRRLYSLITERCLFLSSFSPTFPWCQMETAKTTLCGLLYHLYLTSWNSPFLKTGDWHDLKALFPNSKSKAWLSATGALLKMQISRSHCGPTARCLWTHESAFFKSFPRLSLTCSIKLEKLCLGKGRLAKQKETTGKGSAAQSSSPLPSFAFPDFSLLPTKRDLLKLPYHSCTYKYVFTHL